MGHGFQTTGTSSVTTLYNLAITANVIKTQGCMKGFCISCHLELHLICRSASNSDIVCSLSDGLENCAGHVCRVSEVGDVYGLLVDACDEEWMGGKRCSGGGYGLATDGKVLTS
jgi:hypothetical protein